MYSIQKQIITTPSNKAVSTDLPFYRSMRVRLLLASIALLFISGCATVPFDYVKSKHTRVIPNRVADISADISADICDAKVCYG